MSPAFEQLIQLTQQLTKDERQEFLAYLQETLETEEEWEDRVITNAAGDALKADGSIDFDLLYSQGGTSAQNMHKDYPDIVDEDGHISPDIDTTKAK